MEMSPLGTLTSVMGIDRDNGDLFCTFPLRAAQVPLESDAPNSPDPKNSALTDQVAVFHDHLSYEYCRFITASSTAPLATRNVYFLLFLYLKRRELLAMQFPS